MQVMETERQTQGVMVVAVAVLLKMVCMQNKLHVVSDVYTIFDAPFNPGHRHANRRGPPRGPKETEISANMPDGKNSKRSSASHGAHEVRLLCNFLFNHGWLQSSMILFYPFSSKSNTVNAMCRDKYGFRSQVQARDFVTVCYATLVYSLS